MDATNSSDETTSRRIGEWAKRLLQLDRRNNLLYFKPGPSAVGITGISIDELEERLRRSRRGLKFPFVPPALSRSPTFEVQADDDRNEEQAVQPGDLTTNCDPVDLQRRLRNLQRRDREWQEEQGLNVLFIAAGFLNWVDEDHVEARSPLVLIPCHLERSSPRDPFRLARDREDDDSTDNPTLHHKLASLGIDLPEFGSDSDEDGSLEDYICRVEALIADRDDISVDYCIALGTFSYSKLAMYEDLMQMSANGVRGELTRVLAGAESTSNTRRSDGPSAIPRKPELAGGRMDDLLDLHDQYTVLPADFSQLRAIEDARQGRNLVIHGPPGTGKSQTITNLIATLIADGKRVLFVSEKTAALDVVKRRLEECNLGAFCLDLHSDRGRKSEVYRQLNSAVNDDRARLTTSVSIDDLVARRDLLNRVVRSLHERREPLGKSIYEVQGLFAQVRHLPLLEAVQTPPASELTADWIREAERVTARIALRPEEFRLQHSSRWIPLRTPQPSLQIADQIRTDMIAVQSAVDKLLSNANLVCEWLGVPTIESSDNGRAIVSLLHLLKQAPAVPRIWLSYDAVARLRRLSRELARQQHERRQLEGTLATWFESSLPQIEYRIMSNALELSPAEREAIEWVVGFSWKAELCKDPSRLLDRVAKLATALDHLVLVLRPISASLEDEELHTLGQIQQASTLAGRINTIDPVPGQWLTSSTIDELEHESREARVLLARLERDEEQLSKEFSDGLVELVDEEMLVRYRTDHRSLWRRLGGTYRRDQRTLRGQLKKPRKLSLEESLDAIDLAVEVKRQREVWNELEPSLLESLGSRFRGRETDWERTLAEFDALRGVLANWRGDANVLRELLAMESENDRRRTLELASQSLRDALERYRNAADAVGHPHLLEMMLEVARTSDVARRSLVPLRRLQEATAELYRSLAAPPSDFDVLTQLVEDGVRLMAVMEEDERLAPRLVEDFGAYFEREATDWKSVSHALEWTANFLDEAAGRVSDTLAVHAVDPWASGEYEERAESLRTAIAEFSQRLNVLDIRFNIAATSWDSWHAAPFADLEAWSADLRKHAADAPMWIEYRDAVLDLEERLGLGSAAALRAATDRAETVPGVVQRRIYAAWLEELYEAEPELRSFSRVDHEGVRAQFRDLDKKFPFAARQRVRERAFEKYPDRYETPLQGGQLGTLKGELSKRTRLMPVRKLIERIPNLLQTLKPCFLMSPLAVSQYLPIGPLASDRLEFDAVIFDEASQVWPEDALPAIERGRQVIVVGDRMQLPPTNFFRTRLNNDDDLDDDDDDDSDSIEGRESILDVMVGQVGTGFAERYLNVHYRSRSESLISFSNNAFYENRLLTFPSPTRADDAVRDVYLPNATYDMGRTTTNREEAERVTDLVFEFMTTRPHDESIGVVALSRKQADLIESLIEERRLLHRHLDQRFSEELTERFFVKNLENVQGDERDHMILSICYGPTPAGAVPNRFGPINRDGGERRLNVAVTRARMSMTVVHSLRAEDIRSPQPGARQLRRYLEYVRNPERAFESEVTGVGEPESPFEEAVLAALRQRGHRVDSQVGVSGYRIDLAIKSEDGTRYDLGIECDGATIHNSPTARDRDWLRQQVLERLGWRIHRVLSTSWVKSPETEIDAIERALEEARTDQASLDRATSSSKVQAESAEPPDITEPTAAPQWAQEPVPPPQLFDEYRRYEGKARRADLLSVPLSALSTVVRGIIDVEQPVHIDTIIDRVRDAYGAPRAGKRIRDRVEQAIESILGRPREKTMEFLKRTKSLEQPRPRRDAKRPIDRVAGPEIDEALMVVARVSFGIEQGELVRETSRQFGWRRTGQEIERRLNDRVERLLKEERLELQGNMLVANNNA